MVQIGRDRRVPTCEGQRRLPLQRRVATPHCSKPGTRQASVPNHRHSRTAHGPEILAGWSRSVVRRTDVIEAHTDGLEFVDLQNPKFRPPTVRLEERIMIGAEMPRCALTMDGSVEHATDIGGRDGSPMHADTDEATRELVHDHEHPVAPEHDGFAPKEVHAPEAVFRVSNERQPRGPRFRPGRGDSVSTARGTRRCCRRRFRTSAR